MCCENACAGGCQTCAAAGSVGTCTNHPAGADPENACGSYSCNGAGACNVSCTGQPVCTSVCDPGAWCAGNACQADKANGATCGSGCECSSGNCIDGVCCDTPCSGNCMTCGGATPGTCANYAAGTDPQSECGLYTCNGAGACYASCSGVCSGQCKSASHCSGSSCASDLANGMACTAACQCATGACTAFYPDGDGDGYGLPLAPILRCGTTLAGHSTNNTDCCDTDSAARPGATGWFTTPRAVCGGYDYNCSGANDFQYTNTDSCQVSGACFTFDRLCETPYAGWVGPLVIPCGNSGSYYASCTVTSTCGGAGTTCTPSSSTTRTQGCH